MTQVAHEDPIHMYIAVRRFIGKSHNPQRVHVAYRTVRRFIGKSHIYSVSMLLSGQNSLVYAIVLLEASSALLSLSHTHTASLSPSLVRDGKTLTNCEMMRPPVTGLVVWMEADSESDVSRKGMTFFIQMLVVRANHPFLQQQNSARNCQQRPALDFPPQCPAKLSTQLLLKMVHAR